ncbi:MAG: response regulator [Deltaproteobacteria bacterium]|nr:MAG: response regulator [Deltaproteobacteria bacterium]
MQKTVLVIDDSATVRTQLRQVLSGGGYRVLEAEDGARGIEQAEAHEVDMMIVDVNMPVMDGITMVSRLRQSPKHAATPIFMLTTEASRDVVARGKAAGANAWIVKPFKPDLLLKGVRKVLS